MTRSIRLLSLILIVGVMMVFGLAKGDVLLSRIERQASPVVRADTGATCSLASLNGTYGLERQGNIIAEPAGITIPLGPFGEVNTVTFNGAGSFTGKATVNIGGAVLSSVGFSGTYTVNPDCTGTNTVNTDLNVTLHNAFVALEGGRRFIETQTDAWGVVQGTGERLAD